MFNTIEELAFDKDVNLACINLIKLAQLIGVPDERILRIRRRPRKDFVRLE